MEMKMRITKDEIDQFSATVGQIPEMDLLSFGEMKSLTELFKRLLRSIPKNTGQTELPMCEISIPDVCQLMLIVQFMMEKV